MKFIAQQLLGEIVYSVEPSEAPDFILETSKSLVSIELTRVINPKLKQRESAQNRIVDNAMKKFKEIRNDILKVYVDYSYQPLKYHNSFLDKLSNDLCNFVLRVCENNEGFGFRISTRDWLQAHEFFQSISITNDTEFENWQPFGAYVVPHIDETWFKSRIDEKERNLLRYSDNFDQNWLVLNCDFGHESSAFNFNQLKEDYRKSCFDKIYIYQYFRDTVISLK